MKTSTWLWPPTESGGKLKADEIAALDQWIRYGLADPRDRSTAVESNDSQGADGGLSSRFATMPSPSLILRGAERYRQVCRKDAS